jgi:hypothetical protein
MTAIGILESVLCVYTIQTLVSTISSKVEGSRSCGLGKVRGEMRIVAAVGCSVQRCGYTGTGKWDRGRALV